MMGSRPRFRVRCIGTTLSGAPNYAIDDHGNPRKTLDATPWGGMTSREGFLIAKTMNAIAEGRKIPSAYCDDRSFKKLPRDTTEWPYRIEIRGTCTKGEETWNWRKTEYAHNKERADNGFYQYRRLAGEDHPEGKVVQLSLSMFYGPGSNGLVETFEFPLAEPNTQDS